MIYEEIENLVKEYKSLHRNSIDKFVYNQYEISQVALDIFIKLAEISNLDLKTVVLEKFEKIYESTKEILLEASTLPVSMPEFGNVSISNTKGTVVFVDITKSTEYFKEEKNYTGFVIFNAYVLLVKTITRLSGGEFLEHTGDGAMIFFENKDIIKEYRNCKKFSETNPLCLYFIVSEHIKNYAKEKGLLKFNKHEYEEYISEPSLVHVGTDYGDILEVNLGDMKKLISKTVWNAANRCKNANRWIKYEPTSSGKTYYDLPINLEG